MRNQGKKSFILKTLLALLLTVISVTLICIIAPSCKGGSAEEVRVGFVSADYCTDGEMNESKMVPYMNAQIDERVYMVVDFKIKAPRNNDGTGIVNLKCEITPADAVDFTVQETNTGETSEITADGVTTINAVYKIPDKKTETRDIRFIASMSSKNVSVAEITLNLTCPSNLKAVKPSTVKKTALIGYSEDLLIRDSAVVGVEDRSVKQVIIPQVIKGQTITQISEEAFANCKELETVYLPDSVTVIENKAFSGCSKLKKINIPAGYKGIIGYKAFYGCASLTNITLPDGLTCISEDMFSGCGNLAEINVPQKVKKLYNGAFSNCGKLTEITLPDALTSIGESAFSGCASLTKINIPEKVKEIGHNAFKNCKNLASVKYDAVNSVYDGYEVVVYGISDRYVGLFADTVLSELEIGAKVKSLPAYVFAECKNLSRLVIPNNVKTIDKKAFAGCKLSELKKISIGRYVKDIDVVLPDKDSSKLESIEVDKKNKYYKSRDNCLLTKDGKTLLLGCKDSVIPDGVTAIGEKAFFDCVGLESLDIPKSVTVIGISAFSGCTSLTKINLPDQLTEIGGNAFSRCEKLSEITIPISVTSIGSNAFGDCKYLGSIKFGGRKAQWKVLAKASLFNEQTANCIVTCVNGNLDKNGNETE